MAGNRRTRRIVDDPVLLATALTWAAIFCCGILTLLATTPDIGSRPTNGAICAGGICPSCPTRELVARQIYVLCNDPHTKFARWVAYVVRPEWTNGSPRARIWHRDPALPKSDTLGPRAYRGARRVLGTDRGHQAPLASFSASSEWPWTDYLSNITPQRSALNEGPWAHLESAVRRAARSHRIAVVTGPLYDGRTIGSLPAAPSAIVPTGYWKIIVVDGRSLVAFAMPQRAKRSAPYCAAVVPRALVVARAGFDPTPGIAAGTPAAAARAAVGCAPSGARSASPDSAPHR